MSNSTRLCISAVVAISIITGISCNRDPNVVKVKYLENGNRYFDNGKYKEAYIMYRNALKKDQRYSEAYYRIALTEMKLRRPLEASRDFRRAIDTDQKRQDAREQLGELYLLAYLSRATGWQTIPPMVKTLSDELLKLNAKSATGYRLKGYFALTERKLPEAIEAFRRANELTPFKPEIVLPLAESLFAGGQKVEADKLCRALIEKQKTYGPAYDLLYLQAIREKRNEDGEAILKLKIANNPASTDAMLQLARHYFATQRQPEMRGVLEKVGSKDYAEGRMQVGRFYRAIRDFDSAIRHFQEGLKETPQRKAEFLKATAEVMVIQRRQGEAVKILEQLIKDNPNDDQAQAMRAALLIETGNPKDVQIAINDLQAVVSRMPTNAVLRFNLGRALQAQGKFDQARTQYLESARLQKDFLHPRLALAQLYLFRKDWGQALQYSNEVLQLDPRNLAGRLIHSSAQAAVSNLEQSRKELAETLQLYPNSVEAHIQVAQLDMAEKKYQNAEEIFAKLYQNNPEDLRGLMGLTETYAAENKYDKAIQVLKTELGKHPDRLELRLALGNLAFRTRQYDLAIEHFQSLIKVRPNAGDLYLRIGEVYRVKGDRQKAQDAFRRAKELRPNDPVPHLQLALLLDADGLREQARPIYNQVLKLQPDNPVALNNLAFMMAEDGEDLDRALSLAQQAKQKMPEDVNVSDTLGWIYIKKNLSDQAIQIFRSIVSKQPERSTFRYHLAMALYQKGDKIQARKELETALQKKPAKAEEAKIRELMGKLG